MNTQLRYSLDTWPLAPLPLPEVRIGTVHELADGWVVIGMHARGDEIDFVHPPPEMHLREMRDVDLRDPERLIELTNITGDPVNSDQPWKGFVNPHMLTSVAAVHYPQMVANVAAQCGLELPASWEDRPSGGFHVTEVAMAVTFIRLLVAHLDRALAGEPTAPVWQRAGYFDDVEYAERIYGVAYGEEPAEKVAWSHFAATLNDGLAPFSAHVIPPEIAGLTSTRSITTSYSAACLLIFNDLVEGLPYRRCADETCGRLFRHQLGRSTGQFRRNEGVAFCSPRHARNQAQRERRRRERADRRKEDS